MISVFSGGVTIAKVIEDGFVKENIKKSIEEELWRK